jgi:predicted dienelactone hydrolase
LPRIRSSGPPGRWASSGPHSIVTAEVSAWSSVDGETMTVLARYPVPPQSGHPVPVIVFCHGLGGSQRSYAALGAHLASHGYAVLHPQFLDSFPLASDALGLTGAGLTGVDERTWPRHKRARDAMMTMLFDPLHWMSRVTRVHSVIDSLATQRHLPVALRPDSVIVGGHSFGAYTAQLVLGARLYEPGLAPRSFAHASAAAGVLLSPQGSGDRGLTSRSWDAITQPLLVVTGTNDFGPHGEGLAWRREPFDTAPSRRKHLAVVRHGTHLLGGISLADGRPGQTAVRDAILAVTAAFADRVDGDLKAGDWVASGPFPAIFKHEHLEEAS